MIDIEKILENALRQRSIFHSEADFQHHLAWQVHEENKDCSVRLEYPIQNKDADSKEDNKREYCDILLRGKERVGIELKYKTKKAHQIINREEFNLKEQGARDAGCYGFIKDISRLENWVSKGIINTGYAILLTNDKNYWDISTEKDTSYPEFKIYDENVRSELLKGIVDNKKVNIKLAKKYKFIWGREYTISPDLIFRYLCIKIPPNNT